eukprot:m.20112 g.20112  ORF g.20112 m.20112 type:complete len:548 (+) comp7758_c0_seq1:201-1844(+)
MRENSDIKPAIQRENRRDTLNTTLCAKRLLGEGWRLRLGEGQLWRGAHRFVVADGLGLVFPIASQFCNLFLFLLTLLFCHGLLLLHANALLLAECVFKLVSLNSTLVCGELELRNLGEGLCGALGLKGHHDRRHTRLCMELRRSNGLALSLELLLSKVHTLPIADALARQLKRLCDRGGLGLDRGQRCGGQRRQPGCLELALGGFAAELLLQQLLPPHLGVLGRNLEGNRLGVLVGQLRLEDGLDNGHGVGMELDALLVVAGLAGLGAGRGLCDLGCVCDGGGLALLLGHTHRPAVQNVLGHGVRCKVLWVLRSRLGAQLNALLCLKGELDGNSDITSRHTRHAEVALALQDVAGQRLRLEGLDGLHQLLLQLGAAGHDALAHAARLKVGRLWLGHPRPRTRRLRSEFGLGGGHTEARRCALGKQCNRLSHRDVLGLVLRLGLLQDLGRVRDGERRLGADRQHHSPARANLVFRLAHATLGGSWFGLGHALDSIDFGLPSNNVHLALLHGCAFALVKPLVGIVVCTTLKIIKLGNFKTVVCVGHFGS